MCYRSYCALDSIADSKRIIPPIAAQNAIASPAAVASEVLGFWLM